eukprot:GSMAST32.ASY1.ANO1.1899.1 assembled CDS
MGGTGTFTNLHCDKGGLSIIIAPIVGTKEVIAVHRSDGKIMGSSHNPLKTNLVTHPLFGFARSWKCTVIPGDILLMPAGTYHSVKNKTPCFSYHRMHIFIMNFKFIFFSYEILYLTIFFRLCFFFFTIHASGFTKFAMAI